VRRYPSDTTDAQWALIDRLLPDPAWMAGRGGRPEAHCRRQIVDAIFYLVDNASSGGPCRSISRRGRRCTSSSPGWQAGGITQLLLDMLRERVRLVEGRSAAPTAAIIDSQSVQSGRERSGGSSRGYDAGKKINGRKRHIAVDTLGLLLLRPGHRRQRPGPRRRPTPTGQADQQLSAGAAGLGDGGYAGKLLDWARESLHIAVQIVKRSDDMTGFVCPTKTLGCRAEPGLDYQTPPLRPRLRSPPRPPRSHGPLGP